MKDLLLGGPPCRYNNVTLFKGRVARVAQLFFLIYPIGPFFSGVVVAVQCRLRCLNSHSPRTAVAGHLNTTWESSDQSWCDGNLVAECKKPEALESGLEAPRKQDSLSPLLFFFRLYFTSIGLLETAGFLGCLGARVCHAAMRDNAV